MYRKKNGRKSQKVEEMHKFFCISSFLFCNFALVYRLGIFIFTYKRGIFIGDIAGEHKNKDLAICTK